MQNINSWSRTHKFFTLDRKTKDKNEHWTDSPSFLGALQTKSVPGALLPASAGLGLECWLLRTASRRGRVSAGGRAPLEPLR